MELDAELTGTEAVQARNWDGHFVIRPHGSFSRRDDGWTGPGGNRRSAST